MNVKRNFVEVNLSVIHCALLAPNLGVGQVSGRCQT
jgi:hypothetical protein